MPDAKLTLNHAESVLVSTGTKLDEILKQQFPLYDAPCNGKGTCGKCRVTAAGLLSEPTPAERKTLTDQELAAGIRLACQVRVEGDASVEFSAIAAAGIVMTEGNGVGGAVDPMFRYYGAAIDLGTTTLAANLFSREGMVAQTSATNCQINYGADVVSRLESSLAGNHGALASEIQQQLNQLLLTLAEQAGISGKDIDAVVITGNTAMLSLLFELPVDSLARLPFQAPSRFGEEYLASRLALSCCPDAKLVIPPCFSAFVGADTNTALLASDFLKSKATSLLVDIGTNGEIALVHEGRLFCCSVAAGPVFEGAGIHKGSRGVPGAIDHVVAGHGQITISTIGNGEAKSICGSGIIDAVAAMVSAGVLDETGLIQPEGHPFEDRVLGEGSEAQFLLSEEVSITQKDIRMVQLAKSAVCAGILTLLSDNNILAEDVDIFGIAGGFGSFLNLESAAAIGLFPPALLPKAVCFGNAALSGASQLLLNKNCTEMLKIAADNAKIAELATHPVFIEEFVEQMML